MFGIFICQTFFLNSHTTDDIKTKVMNNQWHRSKRVNKYSNSCYKWGIDSTFGILNIMSHARQPFSNLNSDDSMKWSNEWPNNKDLIND